MRAAGLVLAPLLALLAAAPAQAVLVFERPGTREIVAAADDGSAPRVVGHGHSPAVSPSATTERSNLTRLAIQGEAQWTAPQPTPAQRVGCQNCTP